jgi:hypothetical protein
VVTLTPAATFIAQAQPLQVAVAVAAAGSNPTPTGSIQLVSGSYSSAPAALTGGSATITIPAGSLAAGSPTVFALYTPDAASSATYNNASGLVSITVANLAKVTPVVGVSASTAITTVDSLKVFISVTTAGSYPSATGSVTLTSGTYSSGATALSLGGATITIPAGSLATGDDTLTVSYTPDDNSSGIYSSATGTAAVTVTTPPPPSFTVSGTAISILPGASTGNTSTITLTPSGGFTGAVSLTCAITPVASNDPAQCSIPASVTISGTAAQTVTLAVSSTASTTAFNQKTRFFWPSAGSAALAVVLLFGIPARRRQWRNLIGAIVLLAALTGGLASCGGSSGGGGGGGGGNPGTTAGTYTITVTGTSGSITQTGSVTLTVE